LRSRQAAQHRSRHECTKISHAFSLAASSGGPLVTGARKKPTCDERDYKRITRFSETAQLTNAGSWENLSPFADNHSPTRR
jgi:hypothetical protein